MDMSEVGRRPGEGYYRDAIATLQFNFMYKVGERRVVLITSGVCTESIAMSLDMMLYFFHVTDDVITNDDYWSYLYENLGYLDKINLKSLKESELQFKDIHILNISFNLAQPAAIDDFNMFIRNEILSRKVQRNSITLERVTHIEYKNNKKLKDFVLNFDVFRAYKNIKKLVRGYITKDLSQDVVSTFLNYSDFNLKHTYMEDRIVFTYNTKVYNNCLRQQFYVIQEHGLSELSKYMNYDNKWYTKANYANYNRVFGIKEAILKASSLYYKPNTIEYVYRVITAILSSVYYKEHTIIENSSTFTTTPDIANVDFMFLLNRNQLYDLPPVPPKYRSQLPFDEECTKNLTFNAIDRYRKTGKLIGSVPENLIHTSQLKRTKYLLMKPHARNNQFTVEYDDDLNVIDFNIMYTE